MSALITEISHAVAYGKLDEPFTVQIVKEWMTEKNVVKNNGDKYAPSSINSILSKSDLKNRHSRTTNARLLQSRVKVRGKHEYWFDTPPTRPPRRRKGKRDGQKQ